MTYQEEMEINIMAIDATFWVAVSFVIFFGGLIFMKSYFLVLLIFMGIFKYLKSNSE